MNIITKNHKKTHKWTKILTALSLLGLSTANSFAAVTLETDIKVTDQGLYFDGEKKSVTQARNSSYVEGQKMDYAYGRSIVPHGDAIKVYKDYVFMTWYRGGILDRHMMLTRYNMKTGKKVDIEFPHQHTGFEGRWWIGETHNVISVAISPKDETIHLLFDMHAYTPGKDTGGNGSFKNDYFRYAYSVEGAATVADDDFTLAQFVKDTSATSEGANDYNHVTMTGIRNDAAFGRLSYPNFFQNDQGDLFLHMRQGSSHDGRIVFNKYEPEQKKWGSFKSLNVLGAGNKGDVKNWSIYGIIKYQDGKIRVGFQRRLNRPDKFYANEGMYYAYSDDPTGATDWKNYQGESIDIPFVAPDDALVFDQSTLIPHATDKDQVSITGGFDWAVTDNGDVHMIGRVSERVNNKNVQTIYSHHYQVGGKGEFIHKTDFPNAAEIYAAGNNIYIIGLEDGRPFIEQAKGGTNDFTRVYHAPTDSMKFQKGVVYIHQGKVYYYLLKAGGTGDSRTTHLQVIDLDIQPEGPENYAYAAKEGESVAVAGTMDIAFGADGNFTYLTNQTQNLTCDAATFSVPDSDVKAACFTLDVTPNIDFANDLALLEGYDRVNVTVNASVAPTRTIHSVDLYYGDQLISSDDSAPFQWSETSSQLANLAVGSHSLKAVITDSEGLTAEVTKQLTVADGKPSISIKQSPTNLKEGYPNLMLTASATSPDPSRDIKQVALYLGSDLVSVDSQAPYQWTQAETKLASLQAGEYIAKTVVTDNADLTNEAEIKFTVAQATPKPTDDDKPAKDDTASSGGGSTSGWVISLLALLALRRKSQ
ncbi:hypothetical protein DS2_07833 [Catenovulum agarivorans DS-2]|uniref:Uncharacterized protein n=1 Tax=Catenovulum agarivorans DS-2 TaxID=1328313 RepID=W7QNJ9_9ALTE|nr:BNR-4 repeat-containing protein [Catenovulum agarivorans]EWH10527.1 hypothetical protein DS2_07833 [Catenovulum agarivorans DS-2]